MEYYKESFKLWSIHDDPFGALLRFKIAAKILLHELNVHAEKMFDLTFKFEAENNEQTRILIIVNTIKNRDERNPAKTKSLG
ncbi:hypothetical protein Tco_1064115 [Tanacetum coccineum]